MLDTFTTDYRTLSKLKLSGIQVNLSIYFYETTEDVYKYNYNIEKAGKVDEPYRVVLSYINRDSIDTTLTFQCNSFNNGNIKIFKSRFDLEMEPYEINIVFDIRGLNLDMQSNDTILWFIDLMSNGFVYTNNCIKKKTSPIIYDFNTIQSLAFLVQQDSILYDNPYEFEQENDILENVNSLGTLLFARIGYMEESDSFNLTNDIQNIMIAINTISDPATGILNELYHGRNRDIELFTEVYNKYLSDSNEYKLIDKLYTIISTSNKEEFNQQSHKLAVLFDKATTEICQSNWLWEKPDWEPHYNYEVELSESKPNQPLNIIPKKKKKSN
jgi:hypothetical protein